jgi:hypothetical protein
MDDPKANALLWLAARAGSQSGVAMTKVSQGIARRHGGRVARGNVTITTITRSGS